ncbi:hypothetical protein JT358_04195 [Micrococcales bacterium 31B]|nr:hypothetical protein [Micrococcales bacterium 31B]
MKTLIALACGVGLGVYANRKYNEAKQNLTPQQMVARSAKVAGKAAVAAAKGAGKAAAGAAKSYVAQRTQADAPGAGLADAPAAPRGDAAPGPKPHGGPTGASSPTGGFSFRAPAAPKPAPRAPRGTGQGVPGYKASGFPE